jgi:hypothetical protein
MSKIICQNARLCAEGDSEHPPVRLGTSGPTDYQWTCPYILLYECPVEKSGTCLIAEMKGLRSFVEVSEVRDGQQA